MFMVSMIWNMTNNIVFTWLNLQITNKSELNYNLGYLQVCYEAHTYVTNPCSIFVDICGSAQSTDKVKLNIKECDSQLYPQMFLPAATFTCPVLGNGEMCKV